MEISKMIKNLLDRKKALDALMHQKVLAFNQITATRDKLSSELVELNGKLTIIKELLIDEGKPTDEKINEPKDDSK